MSEYIVDVGDADELYFELFQKRVELFQKRVESCFGYPIREEVVRCRDCVYYGEHYGKHWCTLFGIMTMKDMSDGFCKWGERKKND